MHSVTVEDATTKTMIVTASAIYRDHRETSVSPRARARVPSLDASDRLHSKLGRVVLV
jgi:hypothetical protein